MRYRPEQSAAVLQAATVWSDPPTPLQSCCESSARHDWSFVVSTPAGQSAGRSSSCVRRASPLAQSFSLVKRFAVPLCSHVSWR